MGGVMMGNGAKGNGKMGKLEGMNDENCDFEKRHKAPQSVTLSYPD
jgi:hypothetical protein